MKLVLLLGCVVVLSAGELRFAMRSDPKTLDPLAVTDQNSDIVRHLTASRLVRRNRVSQKLEPELAEKWEVREQGKLLVFRLKTGLRFSDGTPLDSQDVKATLGRLLDPAKAYPMSEGLRAAGITSIETPTPAEVRIRTNEPVAGLESFFEEVPILSSRSPLKDRAASGPFVLGAYQRGHSLQFQRNPNYFRKDAAGRSLPRLDAVRIDIQANPELERSRFERGELHFLSTVDPESFPNLEKSHQAIDAGPTLDSEVLWFNQFPGSPLPEFKKRWFQSLDFRRAISAALHRDDLVRVVYGSRAIAGVGPMAPSSKEWASPRLRAQPYNLQTVKSSLEKGGFQNRKGQLYDAAGNAVIFSLLTNAGNRLRMRMATMIQQDLAKIGITLQIVALDMPSLLERMTRSSNYEAILLGIVGIDLDPNDQMNVWMSSSASHPWNPAQKQPQTSWEADIDRLLKLQFHAPTSAKRKAYLHQFQQIVADQAPILYLVHPNALVAASAQLSGLRVSSLTPRVLWNVEELDVVSPVRAANP